MPSSMSSETPPTRVAIAGTLQAIASRAARAKDSIWLGMIMRSAAEKFVDVVMLAEKVSLVLDIVAEGKPFCSAAIGTVADKHEARDKRVRRGRRLLLHRGHA